MPAPRSGRLALFARYGDDAAEALVRHQEIAVALIERFGAPAARAVKNLDGRNARRLAMLAADGPLFRAGRADELLEVIRNRIGVSARRGYVGFSARGFLPAIPSPPGCD